MIKKILRWLKRIFKVPSAQERQEIFFRTTFLLVGRIVKVDGKVSTEELYEVEKVWKQMHLSPERKKDAVNYYSIGKSGNPNLDEIVDAFLDVFYRNQAMIQLLMRTLFEIAYADHDLSVKEDWLLQDIGTLLGVSELRFAQVHQKAWDQARLTKSEAAPSATKFSFSDFASIYTESPLKEVEVTTEISQAYAILELPSNPSANQIKKSYRKLVKKYHPDKILSQGLPKEMQQIAVRQFQRIQEAYELLHQKLLV